MYNLTEHRHRFAAWCSSTAARSSPNCKFTVKEGVEIIEKAKLSKMARGWNDLPEASDFDAWHHDMRKEMLKYAKSIIRDDKKNEFTHGVAAKMINCYLKSLYLAGVPEELSEENKKKQNAIHPPIDRILLSNLAEEKVGGEDWKKYRNKGWSNFSSKEYEEVIELIKNCVKGGGLWEIEKHWSGYQTSNPPR